MVPAKSSRLRNSSSSCSKLSLCRDEYHSSPGMQWIAAHIRMIGEKTVHEQDISIRMHMTQCEIMAKSRFDEPSNNGEGYLALKCTSWSSSENERDVIEDNVLPSNLNIIIVACHARAECIDAEVHRTMNDQQGDYLRCRWLESEAHYIWSNDAEERSSTSRPSYHGCVEDRGRKTRRCRCSSMEGFVSFSMMKHWEFSISRT